ncbi:gluconokinase-like [Salvia miltiorrhiza]|uniref:gluconokinase-like n=1 Tax=Salvia miltiorrhiza TaxID=226208 RepID=UPI0025AD6B29|nr:gluconokinase-like [Salvia miltiorrhiza]
MLAQVMNARFLDADDYHPQSNKDKMKGGIPLSDEDRIPWLETLRDALRVSLENGETAILRCSALKKHYREILRCADVEYVGGAASCGVRFVLLSVDAVSISPCLLCAAVSISLSRVSFGPLPL